jgi:hypothetical protein
MVKNFVVIKIADEKMLHLNNLEMFLLEDIIHKLEKRKIICDKIIYRPVGWFTICTIDDSKYCIGLDIVYTKQSYATLVCYKYIRYRRLIPLLFGWKKYYRLLDSGEKIQYLCDQINEILNSDSRFCEIRWIKRDDISDIIKDLGLTWDGRDWQRCENQNKIPCH